MSVALQLCLHYALPTHALNGFEKFATFVESGYLVTSSNTLSSDENVRYGSSAGGLTKLGLQLRAKGMLVEFDNIRCGHDFVEVEEDVLRSLGMGTVGLGEDDNCNKVSKWVGNIRNHMEAYLGPF